MKSLFSFIFGQGAKPSRAPAPPESIENLLSRIAYLDNWAKASSAQREAVERLGFGEPPNTISADQAGALLSARSYAQAVAERATKDHRIEREVSKRLIGFIVADRPLLERVVKWNERSFSRGGSGSGKASPKKDEFWERSLAEARRIVADLS